MVARQLDNIFKVDVASNPINASTEATKGEKCLLCCRHASRYIQFFPFSASYIHFSGSFIAWVLASVFMTLIL